MKTRKSITNLLRGLALGALMIAATGIYFGTTSGGAGDDPSSRGNQVGIAYPSSENSQGLQASAYWIQRDEAEEMAYDELSKNFIGIPSPDTKITGRFLPGVVGGISSPAQNPLAATASNELTGNDFRIMEEQRAADRQDDLRDMIQYWNELKKDEATSSTSDTQVKDPILIMEELREADRRDDERFMIQYWNELKEDEATNSTLNDVRQIK